MLHSFRGAGGGKPSPGLSFDFAHQSIHECDFWLNSASVNSGKGGPKPQGRFSAIVGQYVFSKSGETVPPNGFRTAGRNDAISVPWRAEQTLHLVLCHADANLGDSPCDCHPRIPGPSWLQLGVAHPENRYARIRTAMRQCFFMAILRRMSGR